MGITHAVELVVRPGEVIETTPCAGLAAARESLENMLRRDARDATTPEEKAMYAHALTKVPTMRAGSTISIGNGTAFALRKV